MPTRGDHRGRDRWSQSPWISTTRRCGSRRASGNYVCCSKSAARQCRGRIPIASYDIDDALAAQRGSFLVLTSVDGIEGDEDLPLYSTVKGAQRGLVKGLAREWGPAGVRVNCLAPLALTPAL